MFDTPAALAGALTKQAYVADEGLSTAAFLALKLGKRPDLEPRRKPSESSLLVPTFLPPRKWDRTRFSPSIVT